MIRKWYKLKTHNITLVQFIIEGYEGMATVSTIDPETAVLQILIMPDFVQEIIQLLEHLEKSFNLEEIPAGPSGSQTKISFAKVSPQLVSE